MKKIVLPIILVSFLNLDIQSQKSYHLSTLPALGSKFKPQVCSLKNGGIGAGCYGLGDDCDVKVECKKVPVLE